MIELDPEEEATREAPKIGSAEWWGRNPDSEFENVPKPTTKFGSSLPVEPRKELKPARPTYVYYISDGRGRIKIGHAVNPWGRLEGFKTALPESSLLAYEHAGYDVYDGRWCSRRGMALEHKRHEQFKEEHAAGEWFNESIKLLNFVDLVNYSQKLLKQFSKRSAVKYLEEKKKQS